MLTNLLFALSSRGSNPEEQISGNGSNAVDGNRKQDLNRRKSQEENSSVALGIDNLNYLPSEDEIYCYKNCSFRCPTDKKLFNLSHLLPINYYVHGNACCSVAYIKCTSCGENLYDEVVKFKNKFIKYFIMNPQKDFLDTFEFVLIHTEFTKITEEINLIKNEISDSCLELLLDLLYPITYFQMQYFKRTICNTALFYKENEISSEILEKFLSEIRTNSDNVLELLSKNLEHIKLFSGNQRSRVFDLLLDSNFSDPKTKSDAIFYLFKCFSDCKIFWNLSKSTKIELSMFSLEAKTVKGLKLFAVLNCTPFLDAKKDEGRIAKQLYSLFIKFGHNRIFFQAIKSFSHNLTDQNSKIGFLIKYAPPEMILTADYEFFCEYFGEDFLFEILIRYFKNLETADKAIEYLFKKAVGRTSINLFKLISHFFCHLKNVSRSSLLNYRKVLEIFLSYFNCLDDSTLHLMIEAYKSYKEENGSYVSRNFSRLCSRFSISKSLQEPFKKILGDI